MRTIWRSLYTFHNSFSLIRQAEYGRTKREIDLEDRLKEVVATLANEFMHLFNYLPGALPGALPTR